MMSIEVLFYTQLVSVLGYIAAAFVLYRLLVAQKDAVIELLKERNKFLSDKVSELETQSPDALVDSLARRVEVARSEIVELSKDSAQHQDEIGRKELELVEIRGRLDELTTLLKDTDLVCPTCQAPLTRRDFHTIYGEVGGREVEADIEFVEYACGYSTSDDRQEPISKCKSMG
jgi:chromosome segregation ATPase